ncbi:DUF1800 domain-containing protein [Neolewinella persica]|uniref:DUF1800 domain-containing protein n=1 Tax=Neolewinella persica TaxID=70998 RepID=UPI00037183F7|nr:DUF1800 domain-containing protein [Neolewinella persica]
MSDLTEIQHLYWRAGFGLSPTEQQTRQNWTRRQAIDDLFNQAETAKPLPENASPDYSGDMMSAASAQEKRKKEQQLLVGINYDWVKRMANAEESALLERMTFFWHDHFACETKFSLLATRQLNTLRKHALGNFKDLVLAIARDPSMIRYLNNQQNRKLKPNENFARELMELFTIGRGRYTESDVKEAARAFTGWSSNKEGEYVFRIRQHDDGEKTFMGATGNFNGEDIIDLILKQKETAQFICRKIYACFVNEQVDEVRVNSLAKDFRSSGYDIGQLMQQVFSSDWFYAPENVGNRIKSPIELMAGMMRQLNVTQISPTGLIGMERALGQILLKPPNVAGWPGGRAWIDNSTLLLRLNLAGALFKAAEINFNLAPELEAETKKKLKQLVAEMNLGPLTSLAGTGNGADQYQRLASYLLQAPTPPFGPQAQRVVFTKNPSLMAVQLMSLPEYQLC